MLNKTQKQEQLNQWMAAWAGASLKDQFELIATHYKSALYRTAHRAFIEGSDGLFASAYMNYEWAQDAVQDALTDAYAYIKKRPTYGIRHPSAFFRTLTRNSATGIMKRFYLVPENNLSLEADLTVKGYMTPQESLEGGIGERARAQELHEVMNAVLTKEEIELLFMKYVDDEDYEYLSRITDKSIGTLKSIISRAKAKVRRALVQRWQQEQSEEANTSATCEAHLEQREEEDIQPDASEVHTLDDDFLPL